MKNKPVYDLVNIHNKYIFIKHSVKEQQQFQLHFAPSPSTSKCTHNYQKEGRSPVSQVPMTDESAVPLSSKDHRFNYSCSIY